MSLRHVALCVLLSVILSGCFKISSNNLGSILQQLQAAYNGTVLPIPEGLYVADDGREFSVKKTGLDTQAPGYLVTASEKNGSASEALLYRVSDDGFLMIYTEAPNFVGVWLWYDADSGLVTVRPLECSWLTSKQRQQLGFGESGTYCFVDNAFSLIGAAKTINQSDRDFSSHDMTFTLKPTDTIAFGESGLNSVQGSLEQRLRGQTIYLKTGLTGTPQSVQELQLNSDGSLVRRHFRSSETGFVAQLRETGLWKIVQDTMCFELIEGEICYALSIGATGNIDARENGNAFNSYPNILFAPYGFAPTRTD